MFIKILLAIVLGYAVLFYMLSREGVEVGDTLNGFGVLAPMIILGVQLVNWVFGTDFSDDAWAPIWVGCIAIWTVAAIWFLIDEPRQRRKWEEKLRSLQFE